MNDSEFPTARPFMPDDNSLENLADAAEDCQGCPLYEGADQAVFGAGPEDADVMVVGEQPGRHEDRIGEPFVGPAGQILDDGLEQAGLDREDVYITNAVKHGKFDRADGGTSAKLKIAELDACRPFLETEIEQVSPEVVVALGTMAARSLTQGAIKVGEAIDDRYETAEGDLLFVSYHPSAVLRAGDESSQQQMFEILVRTLDRARREVSPGRPGTERRV